MLNIELITRFFFQVAIIMIACKIVCYFCQKFLKQTKVVGEMVTGVLLGPSFLGLFFPDFQNWLFPSVPLHIEGGGTIPNPSMSILYACSQIGLLFYMFLVGMEFNTLAIHKKIKSAGFISLVGIVFPFMLGFLFVFIAPGTESLFAPDLASCFKGFFLGIALSITAFPMLARILDENKISKTSFGTLALAAGSLDDLVAWIMLALLISLIKNDLFFFSLAVVGTIIYIIVLYFLKNKMKAVFSLFADRDKEKSFNALFGFVVIVLLLCSLVTEKIGIYLVFGSFIAGVMLQEGEFTKQVRVRVYDLISSFFLPLFFVYSGLNTRVDLLTGGDLWLVAILILLIAILGKGVGCAMAAKVVGESWSHSAAIGSLMNARGLMELIAINIGLEQGIITPTLYTILVLMAIITTLLASPLYYLWIRPAKT